MNEPFEKILGVIFTHHGSFSIRFQRHPKLKDVYAYEASLRYNGSETTEKVITARGRTPEEAMNRLVYRCKGANLL